MLRLLNNMSDSGIYDAPWLTKVKALLDSLGMSNLWRENNLNVVWFKNATALRILDIFKQNWKSEVDEGSVCATYRIYKQELKSEKYLNLLDTAERISLAKFRCGSNRLPINSGRFYNTPRNERYCPLCNFQKLGDEFHYLFECNKFESERKKYLALSLRTRPNTLKMYQLFNSESVSVLSKLAKFCYIIMKNF